jgi:hypothetical protein
MEPINMLILLDRSRSMYNETFNTQTFEDITDQAITELVTDPENDLVYFGLAAFPSQACLPEEEALKVEDQCQPTEEWIVEIGANKGGEIADALATLDTCGGTPICDSLAWANDELNSLPEDIRDNQTFLLLATDGAPNCSMRLDPAACVNTNPIIELSNSAQCLDDQCSIDAAEELYNEGIDIFVVGVGQDVTAWADTMDEIADKGSGGDREYFPATGDPKELSDVFNKIIGDATSCTFEIDWDEIEGELVEVKACNKVAVKEPVNQPGDDEPDSDTGDDDDDDTDTESETQASGPGGDDEIEIPFSEGCESETGWHWVGDPVVDHTSPLDMCKEVELCPATCQRLRDGDLREVNFWFGCKPKPI